jgi:peptidoglycan/xylan/chitin deacetylase (PgdA/CDA1 family)
MIKKIYRKLKAIKQRKQYSQHCMALTGKQTIFLLSFDCDNTEDIEDLPVILDFLKQNDIPATFAVPGEILEQGQDVFRQARDDGHDFIGHGYKRHSAIEAGEYKSTLFYHDLTDDEIEQDIKQGFKTIEKILGINSIGFRIPHFGHSQKASELSRVYSNLIPLNVAFSSSTLPISAIKRGPLFRDVSGIIELPISPAYTLPAAILDTYSYGFSPKYTVRTFADFKVEFDKLMSFCDQAPYVINTYCDPSQAVTMGNFWFDSIKSAKDRGYVFMTCSDFYHKFQGSSP